MKKYSEERIINELNDAFYWIEDSMKQLEMVRLLLHRVEFNLLEGEE